MSAGPDRVRGPEAVLLDEDVGEDDEFPHDGREGDLGRLAGVAQRPVLPSEVGVAADRGHGGHVEQPPHLFPAALDEAASLPGPGLAVTGASPARLAARGPLSVPSSGMWTISPAAVTVETQGIDVRISDVRFRFSSLSSSFRISASTRFS